MRKIVPIISACAIFLPLTSFAAWNDVVLTTSAIISVGGYDLNVSGTQGELQSITVNTGSFDITVATSSSLTVVSANQQTLTVTSDPNVSASFTCNTSNGTLVLTAAGAGTVTITPTGTCTPPSGGGGSGYGGGGGGSAYTPPSSSSPADTTSTTAPPSAATSTAIASTTPLVEPATTTVTYVQGPSLTKTLQLGSTDPEVVALQQFLAAKGLLTLPSTIPMGYFGGLTLEALKKFQTSAGLDPVGIVGPLTREAIAATTITKYATSGIPAGFLFTRSLKIGSAGADVAALQQILITKGFLVFNIKSNPGYFGGVTRAALMKFQKSVGIEPVGAVGPATRRALNALTSTPSL